MISRLLLLLVTLFALIAILAPAPASAAYDPFGGSLCSGKRANSTVCRDKQSTDNPLSGPGSILLQITNLVAYIAGAAAIIMIIVSGIKYITSGGDPGKVTSAKDTLVNSLIGIVVIVLARTLIVFIITKLYET